MPSQPIPLVQLIDAAVRLSWPEALALVQSLAAASTCPGGEPDGNAIDHFGIDGSGAVVPLAGGCRFVPVGELALFLGHLLPPSSVEESRAPAGLHYAIARALGLVEGPPIVSVQQFSKSLERFERGDRRELLRAVYARHAGSGEHAGAAIVTASADRFLEFLESDARTSNPAVRAVASPRVERRTNRPSPDALRRMLRDADRQSFDQAAARYVLPGEDARRHNGPTVDMLRRMLREADLRDFGARQAMPQPWSPTRRAYAALVLAAVGAAAAGAGIADRDQLAAYATRIAHRARVTWSSRGLTGASGDGAVHRGSEPTGQSSADGTTSRGVTRETGAATGSTAATDARDGSSSGSGTSNGAPGGGSAGGVATSGSSTDDGGNLRATGDKEKRMPAPPAAAGRSARAVGPAPSVLHHDPGETDDGRLVRALDVSERPIFSPSFASDGSAIFFDEPVGSGSSLMQAKATSDGQMHVVSVVDDGARNYHPHLSPDSRTIAFDSDREGVRGVYLASRDGHNVRRVSGDGYAAVPTWSPDGSRLAFIKAEPGRPKVWNLWSLDIRSGALSRLTSYRYGQPWGASWFPDGRRICYAHEDTLVVLDPTTGASRVYRSPRPHTLVRTPAVSPDGRRVVFQLFRDGAWLLDLADGSMRRVLPDPTAEEFAWAPNGEQVAFHSRRDGRWGVWFMVASPE